MCVLFSVAGVVGFNLIPSMSAEKAVFGNNTFTLTCQYELSDIENIFFIQLTRQRTGSTTPEDIMLFQEGRNASFQDSSLDSRTTVIAPTSTSRTISVQFNNIICSDKGSYTWQASYFDGSKQMTMEKSVNLIIKGENISLLQLLIGVEQKA